MAIEYTGDGVWRCKECGISHPHQPEDGGHNIRNLVNDLGVELDFEARCHCGIHELYRMIENGDVSMPETLVDNIQDMTFVFAIPRHVEDVISGDKTIASKCSECEYRIWTQGTEPTFCPECGEEFNEVDTGPDFPITIDHYLHEQARAPEIEEWLGVSQEEYPDLWDSLRYIGYEEKLTYEVEEDGSHTVVAVNGNEVLHDE